MIKLTDKKGEPVWLNPYLITVIEDGDVVRIGDRYVRVQETPEQIITLIESYRHSRNED